MPFISLHQINKQYSRLPVLRDVDLDLDRGHVTSLVGHNGSGKTTLIKILLGLVKPDSGEVYFDGAKLNGGSEYRDRIGFMAQAARFPDNLTAADLFSMLEDLRGRTAPRKDELVRELALETGKPLRHLSGGTRQKVSAVMAFMFEPDVLVLDEPSAGLDPVSAGFLKDLIAEERGRGRTILLTSHIMSEIEELSDSVVFIHDGQIRFRGTADAIRNRTGARNLERAIGSLMLAEVA